MNVDLLSSLLQKLLADNDSVSLGSLGTFFYNEEGAGFSSQGYVILPPQRKIVFREQQVEDTLLADALALEHGFSRSEAVQEVGRFLAELKKRLYVNKVVELPSFGFLRATKENNLFFVPFENVVVDRDNFALESLSLKVSIPEIPVEESAEPIVSKPENETSAAQSETPLESMNDHSKRLGTGAIVAIVVAVLVILTVAGFFILAYGFPQIMEKLLYTPEEIELLHQLF